MSINHCVEVDAYNYEKVAQSQVTSVNSTTLGCETSRLEMERWTRTPEGT